MAKASRVTGAVDSIQSGMGCCCQQKSNRWGRSKPAPTRRPNDSIIGQRLCQSTSVQVRVAIGGFHAHLMKALLLGTYLTLVVQSLAKTEIRSRALVSTLAYSPDASHLEPHPQTLTTTTAPQPKSLTSSMTLRHDVLPQAAPHRTPPNYLNLTPKQISANHANALCALDTPRAACLAAAECEEDTFRTHHQGVEGSGQRCGQTGQRAGNTQEVSEDYGT